MIKLLVAVRDILYFIKDFVERLVKESSKHEARGAIDESEKTKSQEPIEDLVSGTSGRATKYKYSKLRTRKKSDRR